MRCICDGITKSGSPCRAPAMPGDTRCISHSENPKIQELKRQAVSKGGKALKKVLVNLPLIEAKTSEDVHRILAETLTLLRTDALEPPKAKAILGLCRELLPFLREQEFEREQEENADRWLEGMKQAGYFGEDA